MTIKGGLSVHRITTIVAAILLAFLPVNGFAQAENEESICLKKEEYTFYIEDTNGNLIPITTYKDIDMCHTERTPDSDGYDDLQQTIAALAASGAIYAIIRTHDLGNWTYDEAIIYNGKNMNHKFIIDYGSIYQMNKGRLRDHGAVLKYSLQFKRKQKD